MRKRVKQWLAVARAWFLSRIHKHTRTPLCVLLARFRTEKWSEGIAGAGRVSILMSRTTLVVSYRRITLKPIHWIKETSNVAVRVPFARRVVIELGMDAVNEITETTMLEKFAAMRVYRRAQKESRKAVRAAEARVINACN